MSGNSNEWAISCAGQLQLTALVSSSLLCIVGNYISQDSLSFNMWISSANQRYSSLTPCLHLSPSMVPSPTRDSGFYSWIIFLLPVVPETIAELVASFANFWIIAVPPVQLLSSSVNCTNYLPVWSSFHLKITRYLGSFLFSWLDAG